MKGKKKAGNPKFLEYFYTSDNFWSAFELIFLSGREYISFRTWANRSLPIQSRDNKNMFRMSLRLHRLSK